MKKYFKRGLCWILVLTLFLSMPSISVLADETRSEAVQETSVNETVPNDGVESEDAESSAEQSDSLEPEIKGVDSPTEPKEPASEASEENSNTEADLRTVSDTEAELNHTEGSSEQFGSSEAVMSEQQSDSIESAATEPQSDSIESETIEEQWGLTEMTEEEQLSVQALDGTGESVVASGTCGENLTWVLESDVLTISGTGDMKNYNSESEVPWYQHRESIKSVVIGDNVTSIGKYAFYKCSALLDVAIPYGVTSIIQFK